MKPVLVNSSIFERIDQSNYSLERKFDGHRALVVVNGSTKLYTRQKNPIEMPKNLASQLDQLKLPAGTILDGEIWNPLKRGSWTHSNQVECRLTLWDCICIGSTDISQKPIEERRQALHSLLKPECNAIQSVEVLKASSENCETIRQEAIKFRSENAIRSGFIHGVVLKRNKSPRRDHATKTHEHPDWLKIVFDGMSGWAP